MPELPIDDLLRELDGAVQPDSAYAARLRREVTRVLAGGELEREETHYMDVTTNQITIAPRRGLAWLGAAAAIAAIALVAGLLLTDDDGPATSVAQPGYLDADVATFDIAGVNPYRVDTTDDAVYVMTLSGDIHLLDPETGAVVRSTEVAESSWLAASDDAVWIADARNGDVLRLDPSSLETVATIATGLPVSEQYAFGVGLATQMGERRAFANIGGIDVDGDDVWVGDRAGRLLHIDPATTSVDRSLDIGIGADLVRVDGDHVLAGDFSDRSIVVIDAASGHVVTEFGPVNTLMGADLHDGAAYVQDAETGVVTRIDLATGAEISTPPLGRSWINGGIPVYAPALRAGEAGVLAETERSMVVLDPVTLDRIGSFELDGNGGEMEIADDGRAWVVRFTTNTLVRITPTNA